MEISCFLDRPGKFSEVGRIPEQGSLKRAPWLKRPAFTLGRSLYGVPIAGSWGAEAARPDSAFYLGREPILFLWLAGDPREPGIGEPSQPCTKNNFLASIWV